MWVLDTNTLIYFFKGEGQVADRLLAHSPRDIGIPAIVLYELQVGIAKSFSPDKRSRQLQELISVVQVLPFHQREAQAAAELRAALEREGRPIGPYDTLIAGTALAHGAILVSRNTREFGRIATLRVENWY
ncbi:type II toxin-antitoxin system VapC family toxin [Halomonas daqiaonensis]|uniref:Ribonuclease VapC n=1 Tax=Halomonas daqiaonensis TaxID=650850 RepID=A0A1H7JVM5_9GAMM|nr:type II toxin-antitoxin system VapC family toxin [Halomonas daqiaonensis]SEK78629.1 tRNA(fMet)-specific endonuclease VapC [Halomonas daqiaonensis]